MEGFWGIFKAEMYYLQSFHTFEELRRAVGEHMDFYNTTKKLKGLVPLDYRNQTLAAQVFFFSCLLDRRRLILPGCCGFPWFC